MNLTLYLKVYILCASSLGAMSTREWMAEYSQDLFNDIPFIPRTNNSGIKEAHRMTQIHRQVLKNSKTKDRNWNNRKTQDAGIAEQLNMGVRFFDLGITTYNQGKNQSDILLSNEIPTETRLHQVIHHMNKFLSMYPSEFVMLYIRPDHSNQYNIKFENVSSKEP